MRHPAGEQREKSIVFRWYCAPDFSECRLEVGGGEQSGKALYLLGSNPVAPASRRLFRECLALDHGDRSAAFVSEFAEIRRPRI